MNQKGFALSYSIIGLVILALIGGAYYFGKTTNKPVVTPQQEIIPTVFVDETSNWKTFTSPEVNYSFKYPSDWIYQGKSEGCGPVFWMPDTNNQIWLTICGPYINPDETPEEIAKRSIGKNDVLISRENIIVNGHQAIKQEKKAADNKFSLEIFVGDVSFKNGSKGTLGIYFYIMDSSKEKEARQVLDRILSTFKFLDQQSITPTITNTGSSLDIVRTASLKKTIWEDSNLGIKITTPEWIESRYTTGKDSNGNFQYSTWNKVTPQLKNIQLSFAGENYNGVSVITGVMMENNSLIPLGSKFSGKTFDEVAKTLLVGANMCSLGWKTSKDQCSNQNQYCYTRDELIQNMIVKKNSNFGPYQGKLYTLNSSFSYNNDCRSEDVNHWLIKAKNNQFVLSSINPDSKLATVEGL